MSLDPIIAPIGQARIDELAARFLHDATIDPELAVEAYLSLTNVDLLDILTRELIEAPNSPLSQSLWQRVRLLCRERAEATAHEIERND